MPALETLLYVLPKWERQSAVPTGILVRLFPGSGHQWLIDQCATAARPSVLHAGQRFSSLTVSVRTFRLFSSVRGSTTVTTPALRFRCAVPVGHHVRVRWYELPASSSTRRMVLVPTVGKPPRRNFRCKVLSDHVAVPSLRRSGCRRAVATIWALALAAYVGRLPRPRTMRTAASPSRLKRSRDQPLSSHSAGLPHARRLDEHASPRHRQQRGCATHMIHGFARAADIRCKGACSVRLSRRKGSRCGVGIQSPYSHSIWAKLQPPTIWAMTY